MNLLSTASLYTKVVYQTEHVNVIPAFISEAVLLVAASFLTRSEFAAAYLAVIMLFVSICFAAFISFKNRKRQEIVEHGVRHTGRITGFEDMDKEGIDLYLHPIKLQACYIDDTFQRVEVVSDPLKFNPDISCIGKRCIICEYKGRRVIDEVEDFAVRVDDAPKPGAKLRGIVWVAVIFALAVFVEKYTNL